MRVFALTGLLAALASFAAMAQPRKEPFYYSGAERPVRISQQAPAVRYRLSATRPFALGPLTRAERARLAAPGIQRKTGIHRPILPAALQGGVWETAPDGSHLWRLTITSPGSQSTRVEFQNFTAGNGKVWLSDGVHTVGPYTGRGLYDNGRFWSAALPAESVTLEYEPESGAPNFGPPPFDLATIVHSIEATGAPDTADYCHLDPNCYADWKPAMSMVGQLMYESDGLQYACSGSLVATRDNSLKPYLLTAGHCINSEDSARSMIVYWTYQTASCGGAPPITRTTSTQSVEGGHLVDFGTISQGDYSLVLLRDVPNGVTFSGWDPTDPPMSSLLTGIHHPAASWKRISFGNRTGDFSASVEGTVAPASKYLEVQWAQGRTEPGSSGSPIFSSPGVITGTLTYGPASPDLSACEIDPSVDGYGRFSNTYQALSAYFENLPAAQIVPAQTDLAFTVADHTASAPQTVSLTTESTGQVTYKLRADAPWINLSTITGAITAKSPSPVKITVDASQLQQPGQYVSTVTILAGAAPPVYINVAVTVKVSQSNVIPSATPNPVNQVNGVSSFTLRLDETAGSATRVTSVKINGADYSGSLNDWFGATHVNARGSLVASIQANNITPGDQYFEFSGVDDGSSLPWYRVLTVTFR